MSTPLIDTPWRASIWQKFGAAITMLDNALRACPDQICRTAVYQGRVAHLSRSWPHQVPRDD